MFNKVNAQVEAFFNKQRDKLPVKGSQEMIDLADRYKEMMLSDSWKDFENRIKVEYEEIIEQLKKDMLIELKDKDVDYEQMKMFQAEIKMIKKVMYIPFLVLARGNEAEKESKRGKNAETGK